jgi:hypothetical protein
VGVLGWFKRREDPAPQTALSAPLAQALVWRPDTSLPIPDWDHQSWPAGQEADLHAHANGLAAAWLDALGAALGSGQRTESPHFMLLTALAPRPAQVLADYFERARRRVLATLEGIAREAGHGKTVVLVLEDEDAYYRYVSHYGSAAGGEEAFSGGMFIDAGYGHFVFAAASFERMEPVVVHELTHCLVRRLPLPAWLNEGLAVNTERRFAPTPPRYQADELRLRFARFWTAQTIQEFWSGKSFLRPDDGQPLSYELARILVELLGKDYAGLVRFCQEASFEDAGEAASRLVLGAGLQELAAVVLGDGPWAPRAVHWQDGTEKGQFQGA